MVTTISNQKIEGKKGKVLNQLNKTRGMIFQGVPNRPKRNPNT